MDQRIWLCSKGKDGQSLKERALILTCGNPHRGDDGVAGQVARALLAGFCDAETRVSCHQQWTPEMAEWISEAELVIFVDASAELAAGEVRSEEVIARGMSPQAFTHSMTPAGLLALAQQVYGRAPASAHLVSIGGDSFDLSEQLSAAALRAIPLALDCVKSILSGVSMPRVADRKQ